MIRRLVTLLHYGRRSQCRSSVYSAAHHSIVNQSTPVYLRVIDVQIARGRRGRGCDASESGQIAKPPHRVSTRRPLQHAALIYLLYTLYTTTTGQNKSIVPMAPAEAAESLLKEPSSVWTSITCNSEANIFTGEKSMRVWTAQAPHIHHYAHTTFPKARRNTISSNMPTCILPGWPCSSRRLRK